MKYLILGAGPAGLTFANKLKQDTEKDFLVLEKEYEAGGLCRSTIVDGAPFDIGGGHFLDVKRPMVNKFLFSFMPEDEWNIFERNSQISINNQMINSPIESNIWQMQLTDQIEYLKDMASAGCNLGQDKPELFIDWIYWKLGRKIANDYMIPYNQKMFANELNELGTYWLDKLPDVSFDETLLSCLTHKAYGLQPGHAKFYYPKGYGYGELWLRMAESIKDSIIYNIVACSIDFKNKIVMTRSGEKYKYEYLISTIPWVEFDSFIGMPDDIVSSLTSLKYSSIETRYFEDDLVTDAHWIYYPDINLPYHRVLVRSNFCKGSKGYWTETRSERVNMFGNCESGDKFLNTYADPLNTVGKPVIMKRLLKWCETQQVYGLGRWGEHQHYNSDRTVELALELVNKFICR